MRRVLAITLAVPAALMLAGCPVYPDDPDCFSDTECAPGYACHQPSGTCFPMNGSGGSGSQPFCAEPKACGVNETCGKDARCHVGTCSFHGCVKGFVCAVNDGVWSCVPGAAGQGGAAGTGGAAGAAGVGGAAGSAGSAGAVEAGAAGDSGVPDGSGTSGDSGVAGAAGSDAGSGGSSGSSGSSADSGTRDAAAD